MNPNPTPLYSSVFLFRTFVICTVALIALMSTSSAAGAPPVAATRVADVTR